MVESVRMPKSDRSGNPVLTSIRPDFSGFNLPIITFMASTSHSLDGDSTMTIVFAGSSVTYKDKPLYLRMPIDIPLNDNLHLHGLVKDIDYFENAGTRYVTLVLGSEKILFDTMLGFKDYTSKKGDSVKAVLEKLAKHDNIKSSVKVMTSVSETSGPGTDVHWNTLGNIFSVIGTQFVLDQMINQSTVATDAMKGSDYIFRIYFDLFGNLCVFPYYAGESDRLPINYEEIKSIINTISIKISEKTMQKYQYMQGYCGQPEQTSKPVDKTVAKSSSDLGTLKLFETQMIGEGSRDKNVPSKYAMNFFVTMRLEGLHWEIRPHMSLTLKNFPWISKPDGPAGHGFIVKTMTFFESANECYTEIICETPSIMPDLALEGSQTPIKATEPTKKEKMIDITGG